MKKTKIICTVGPASSSKQMIEKMFQAGMNGVRINTAYGNLAQYQSVIETVRGIADIPIIIDLKGPEIRIKTSQRKVFSKGDILEIGFDGEKVCFNHDVYDQMEVDDEETVLFTAGMRTTMEHASNSIEIHTIRELKKICILLSAANISVKIGHDL